jgi:hypothetical protein
MWNWMMANRSWMFSGVGVAALVGILRLAGWWLRRLRQRRGEPRDSTISAGEGGGSSGASSAVPDHWQGILPPRSRYRIVQETAGSIPGGLQLVSLEYGPHGHANALTLKDAIVRAEIQFTCRIDDPYKAMFAANQYGLNVLEPRFLVHARHVLEGLPPDGLRLRGASLRNSRQCLKNSGSG